ncbi:C39 family peptidase [Aneurinibacillus terranovensis]|uniref:C39 family peptidase n=1 Tax=Aneurinibacillus terranovensis TaxID=278991 RepID=UPI000485DA19
MGAGKAPTDNIDMIKEMAKKKVGSDKHIDGIKYLYGGPMNLGVQIDILDKGKVIGKSIYHLQGQFEMDQFSDLKISVENKKKAKEKWAGFLESKITKPQSVISPMDVYTNKDLSVRSYNQAYSQNNNTGCGPAAAANILNYWDERGYTNLQSDNDRTNGINLMNHMFGDLQTSIIGTDPSAWAQGMKTHANSHSGYRFTTQNYTYDASLGSTFWGYMVNQINAGHPFGMFFPLNSKPYSWHIVTCRGYYQSSTGSKSYHVNTWGSDAWQDYDSIGNHTLMFVIPGS